MGSETSIPLSEPTRDRLRRYKAIDGQTYDEAVADLLDRAEADV